MSSEICLLGLLKMSQAMFESHPTQLVMKTGDLSTEEEEQQGAPIDKKGVNYSGLLGIHLQHPTLLHF